MACCDVTGAKLFQEKEEQLERAAFWNELASSMSHEIRNPLVAIKTFSQLLPKRYADPDFRAEFSEQVTAEVDQLNHIIDKLNEFASPPKPIFQALEKCDGIQTRAAKRLGTTRRILRYRMDKLGIPVPPQKHS